MIRTSDKKPHLKNLQSVASQLRKPNGLPGKETGLMMNKGNKQMNLAAIRQLDIKSNDCILEIGMGNGFFVKDILSDDKTIRYCGCDFSQTMIKEAMSLNEKYIHDGQAAFINANASGMPFDDETFNKIFTVNTIYFWEETEPVFSEIRRLLKKDGLLVLSFRPKSVMDQLPIVQFGFQTYSIDDCIQILSAHGFRIINTSEKDDNDIELSGIKYKNAFAIVEAIKG